MSKVFGLALLFFTFSSFFGCESDKSEALDSSAPARAPSQAVSSLSRGLRLDPSYFYNSHPGQAPAQVAADVVSTLKNAGVNTIYLYAYNSVYGAFYPTSYPETAVEGGYGAQNIFGAVTEEAHARGLKVVAVVPLNNFKTAWQAHPGWRVKKAGGLDYVPAAETYLLSASSAAYRAWYAGFIDDLVARNPRIDAVEAVEPTLDYTWTGAPDQNPEALSLFHADYPGAAVGSPGWLNFRASEFLKLIALFNQKVHANGKETFLVQTWPANADGSLMDNDLVKNSTGFDFVATSLLSGPSHSDHMISEFIWQQWFDEYGAFVFNPDWAASAGAGYIAALRGAGSTTDLIVHVEISTFGNTSPSLSDFGHTLESVSSLGAGISVYDYDQIRRLSAFGELQRWSP